MPPLRGFHTHTFNIKDVKLFGMFTLVIILFHRRTLAYTDSKGVQLKYFPYFHMRPQYPHLMISLPWEDGHVWSVAETEVLARSGAVNEE